MKVLCSIIFCVLGHSALSQLAFKEVSISHLPAVVRQAHNSMDGHLVDVDQDGDLDIIVAVEFYKNAVLLNDGNGKFADGSHLLPDKSMAISPKPYAYYPYHDSEDIAVIDINADGLLDLIFVTEDDQKNECYLNQQGKVFIDVSDDFPVTGVSNAVASGDLNADGRLDVVIGNYGQNALLINRDGKLKDATNEALSPFEDATQDIELGDFDGDGDLDILVGNEGKSRLLQNDGQGRFEDISDDVFDGGISEETREARFVDVDNDGDLDIYFANVKMKTAKPPVQRLLINSNGKFMDRSDALLDLSPTVGVVDAKFHDVDGDGDLDLILGKVDGLSIATNDGSGRFTEYKEPFTTFPISNVIVDVEITDLNRDGLIDIYLSCYGSGDVLLMGTTQKNLLATEAHRRYETIEEVIDSTYSLLSGPAGKRNWEEFKLLFHPTASMGSVVVDPSGQKHQFYSFTPEKYISNNDAFLQGTDFYEVEMRRHIVAFDGMGQVLSSYYFTFEKNGPVQQRGINSFQLVKEQGRWWITSLVWQAESEHNKIPPEFLD